MYVYINVTCRCFQAEQTATQLLVENVCSENEFYCGLADKCIPQAFRCDGVRDCDSGQDEVNCSVTGVTGAIVYSSVGHTAICYKKFEFFVNEEYLTICWFKFFVE